LQYLHREFSYESHGERILKIGPHFAEVIIKRQGDCFLLAHPVGILSVCPSVRHVPVLNENGLTYCYSFFHHTVAQSF